MHVFGGDVTVQWVWERQKFKILGGGSSRVATCKKLGKAGTEQRALLGLTEYWSGGRGRARIGRESNSILPMET